VSSSATIWSAAAIGTPMIAPITPKSEPKTEGFVVQEGEAEPAWAS
jgi:hypothetical protein